MSQHRTIDPVLWAWSICALLVLTTLVTYARLSAGEVYGVGGGGIRLALSRTIVLLGYPIALVAPALAAFAWSRARSRRGAIVLIAGTALSATALLPGVIDPDHLNARPVNLLAAVGIAACLGVTIAARRAATTWWRLDVPVVPVVIGVVVLVFVAMPWIGAQLGFYVGDVPGLREIYMSKRVMPEPGHPTIRAVHLGNHEGLDGVVLAMIALLLLPGIRLVAPRGLRTALAAYLSLALWYGAAVFANDGWGEQVVKRGWSATPIPSALEPKANITWLVVIIAAAATFVAFRHSFERGDGNPA
jgi:hypothetical protein